MLKHTLMPALAGLALLAGAASQRCRNNLRKYAEKVLISGRFI